MHDGEPPRAVRPRESIVKELREKMEAARALYDADRANATNGEAYVRALKVFNSFVIKGQLPEASSYQTVISIQPLNLNAASSRPVSSRSRSSLAPQP